MGKNNLFANGKLPTCTIHRLFQSNQHCCRVRTRQPELVTNDQECLQVVTVTLTQRFEEFVVGLIWLAMEPLLELVENHEALVVSAEFA